VALRVTIEIEEDVVALDVIMGDIVRVDGHETLEELLVDREVQGEVLIQALRLILPPLPQRAIVPLHHDVVRVSIDPVVIEVRDAGLQTKFLQAGDLREDIMEDAPIVDGLGEEELLDGDILGLNEVGLALVNLGIGSFCYLLPVFSMVVEADVKERGAYQLQEANSCQRRLYLFLHNL
jgi:hypothetical protein